MDKYSGHLIRSKLQKKIFDSFLSRLDGKKALVVLDFKMKFLYRVFRESQSAFFGQRGNSNLGIVLYLNLIPIVRIFTSNILISFAMKIQLKIGFLFHLLFKSQIDSLKKDIRVWKKNS